MRLFLPLKLLILTGTLAINLLSAQGNTKGVLLTKPSITLDTTAKQTLMVVGTYTEGTQSSGIYFYHVDTATGSLSLLFTSPPTANPSYLIIHPNKKWLYTVNELGGNGGKYLGTISAFRIDLDKKQLELVNTVSSHGNYPCHISLDNTGLWAMAANYGNGTVALFPINQDGSLSEATFVDQHLGKGPNSNRQEGPHAHMILQNQYGMVYSPNLGTDKVFVYALDGAGKKLISTNHHFSAQPGAGPRHITFHPNQRWAYVVNELNGTIEALAVEKSTGALTRLQAISTLAKGETREPASADIHITPNGKYLYASNRAEVNNIAMFSIHQATGALHLLGHQPTLGKSPRNFAIDPSGNFIFVANQGTGTIITFKINHTNGLLIETEIKTNVPAPVCLTFLTQ